MNITQRHPRCRAWSIAITLGVLAVGCGRDGKDSIFATNGIAGMAPTVTAVTPVNLATGVVVASPVITATFSEAMAPISGAASFTVTCASPCTSPTGTVTLDASGAMATFALSAGTTLESNTVYTATITGAMAANPEKA